MVRRVGIIGFGHLGQHLASCIEKSPDYELVFVWNRTQSGLDGKIRAELMLKDLDDMELRHPDLVVEVAHPCITKTYGEEILSYCDYMIGSPTAFCDKEVEQKLKLGAVDHAVYVPSGALWGGQDIHKMAELGTLNSLKVTMAFHPQSLKLEGELKEKNANVTDQSTVLYEGPVRRLCQLAPQNTNTMAAAAIAGHNLGFDNVIGCLISDPNLREHHVVEVLAEGFPTSRGSCFQVHTKRVNPSHVGDVTGTATYNAFFASLKRAEGKTCGIHLC